MTMRANIQEESSADSFPDTILLIPADNQFHLEDMRDDYERDSD